MFLCDQWRDYEVLDTGDGEKLERWGEHRAAPARPAGHLAQGRSPPCGRRRRPGITAPRPGRRAMGVPRKAAGKVDHRLPDGLKFYVRPTGFKHTGLFPEQAANWALMQERIAPQCRLQASAGC